MRIKKDRKLRIIQLNYYSNSIKLIISIIPMNEVFRKISSEYVIPKKRIKKNCQESVSNNQSINQLLK